MLDLSLAGLLGAMAGIVVAALVYGPVVTRIERAFRARGEAQTQNERAMFENEVAALRRAVLALDIALFAGIGYWLGTLMER
jgi:hypothetical protein